MHLFDRRFLFVTGKGGVGKTTVALALALAAADRDKRVLLAMTNAKERVSQLLKTEPIGDVIVNVARNLDAVNMTPGAALEEYGMMILRVRALYKAIFENKYVRAFLRGTPGLEAWSMLGKACFHASPSKGEPDYDLVIVDAPATGHALEMLRVPLVIQKIAPPGLLRREADRALEMMRDSRQAGAVLVTLAEDMPVNETIELRDALEGDLGIPVLQIVVNRLVEQLFEPSERDAITALVEKCGVGSPIASLAKAGHRRVMREMVQEQSVERIRDASTCPITLLPHQFAIETDPSALRVLATRLADAEANI